MGAGASFWPAGIPSTDAALAADDSTETLALEGEHCQPWFSPLHHRPMRRVDAQRDVGRLGLAGDEALPRLVALVDDLGRVLAVLGLAGEGKL